MTAAEIAEEEALYLEVKRLEQNEKRYRADRDDLMRSVLGLDSGLVSLDQKNSEGVHSLGVSLVYGVDADLRTRRSDDQRTRLLPAQLHHRRRSKRTRPLTMPQTAYTVCRRLHLRPTRHILR